MSGKLIDWICFILICLLIYLICFFSSIAVLVSGVFACFYLLVLVWLKFRTVNPQLVKPKGRRKLVGINKPHIYIGKSARGREWHCIYGGVFNFGSSPVQAYQKLMFFTKSFIHMGE